MPVEEHRVEVDALVRAFRALARRHSNTSFSPIRARMPLERITPPSYWLGQSASATSAKMRALKTTEVLSVVETFIVGRSLVTRVKTGLFSVPPLRLHG